MALDQALLESAGERGTASLRIYSWSQPTISVGRNQRIEGRFDESRATARGVAFVRRMTGGRALVHHREITYAVAAPMRDEDRPRAAYARITRLLFAALRRLGVDAREVVAAKPARPPADPCFEEPGLGELVMATRSWPAARSSDAAAPCSSTARFSSTTTRDCCANWPASHRHHWTARPRSRAAFQVATSRPKSLPAWCSTKCDASGTRRASRGVARAMGVATRRRASTAIRRSRTGRGAAPRRGSLRQARARYA